jgi:hypothetical protein
LGIGGGFYDRIGRVMVGHPSFTSISPFVQAVQGVNSHIQRSTHTLVAAMALGLELQGNCLRKGRYPTNQSILHNVVRISNACYDLVGAHTNWGNRHCTTTRAIGNRRTYVPTIVSIFFHHVPLVQILRCKTVQAMLSRPFRVLEPELLRAFSHSPQSCKSKGHLSQRSRPSVRCTTSMWILIALPPLPATEVYPLNEVERSRLTTGTMSSANRVLLEPRRYAFTPTALRMTSIHEQLA